MAMKGPQEEGPGPSGNPLFWAQLLDAMRREPWLFNQPRSSRRPTSAAGIPPIKPTTVPPTTTPPATVPPVNTSNPNGGGFDWADLIKLILGITPALGAAFGKKDNDIPIEARQLLDLQRQRLQAQGPLYESVMRLAFNRMPTSATQGLQPPRMG